MAFEANCCYVWLQLGFVNIEKYRNLFWKSSIFMSCLLLCCIRMLLYVVRMLLAETSQVLFLLLTLHVNFIIYL
jgi:hypothetical protein